MDAGSLRIDGNGEALEPARNGYTELCIKARSGERLSRDEAVRLYRESTLNSLGEIAAARRAQVLAPSRVSYLVDRNINYTNVCNSDCSFCGFYRHSPTHPESYVLTKETIGGKIEEALALGATRILLQGGHNDALPYSFYLDLVSWIHENFPIEINAFSPSEIMQMVKVSGYDVRHVLEDLKACGLRGLPGGGAEILDDEIRQRVSPKKIRSNEWIAVMEIAQELGLTTTATMVIGFGETIEHRMNHFDRIRSLQDRSREKGLEGFNAFISWPLQSNENTSLGRSRHRERYGASAAEYLRNLALGRIYLDNVLHHQSSWPTMGPEVAKLGLRFGCDDIGSTMMEENVVSKAGALSRHTWSMSPEELRNHIRDAGYQPVQRNTSFQIVKEFHAEATSFT